ncbi:ABC transporter permease [Stella sp.]|uniref:ABC transporter permease n=1 Tax=Stella sp. TaxID=2912054 RepID=UPI0035AFA0F7
MRRVLLILARQVLLVAAITVAVFLLVRVVPGDVVDILASEGALDAEAVADLRREMGLDLAWPEQFRLWIARAAGGDLGLSLRFETPVADMIALAVPHTLALAAGALAIGLVLGIALAVAATLWPRSPAAWMLEAVNVWSVAVPTFCVGVAAILVFSVWLGWLPALGQTLLPALIIGIDIAGQVVKPLHEELKETMAAPHVRTARAKGLGPARILVRHVLPGSLTVAIALGGIILAGLIGGTITVEVLFGLPGIGTLALDAIRGRDYPLVQAVILVLAVAVVLVNGLTDLLQRLVDPRPRTDLA